MSINICRLHEDDFRNLSGLTWRPWVGVNYHESEQDQVLIVGESHYVWTSSSDTPAEIEKMVKDSSFTRSYIHRNGFWGKSSLILRNIERVLFNSKSINKQQQQALWNSVSFYNFIQRPLSSRDGKHRPNQEDWVLGWNTLFGVVKILRPTHILFCGVEAANAFHKYGKSINSEDFKVAIWKKDKIGRTHLRTGSISIPNEGYSTKLSFIGHPSNFFSWSKWGQCVEGKLPLTFNSPV